MRLIKRTGDGGKMQEAYTLKTAHETIVAVDSKNNLSQVTSLTEGFSKLYAGKYLYGMYCFFLRKEKNLLHICDR